MRPDIDLATDLAASEPLKPVLPAIQQAAEAQAEVCLVGGAVRDLLLGAPQLDIDLAVEGDSLAFARELASQLDAEVVLHERFQTASVHGRGADGAAIAIDVAATRVESYASPGALPQVTAAGLEQDLGRRDFTINAMATSLKRGDFGRLHDPFDGLADLRSGSIRLLHDRSFSDDPTRLLRAVRYEARLGFEIEPRTLALVRATSDAGLLESLPSRRVHDELIDLLSETEVDAALARMHGLGLDRALHPRLEAGARARSLIDAMPDAVRAVALEQRVNLASARLAALCLKMSGGELETWLDRLQFAAPERDSIAEAATLGPELGSTLAEEGQATHSRLYSLLAGSTAETIALAVSADPAAAGPVALFVKEIEPVSLEIGGDDLLAAGVPAGPELGHALRETLNLKLDGLVSGREQELAAALRVLEPGSQ